MMITIIPIALYRAGALRMLSEAKTIAATEEINTVSERCVSVCINPGRKELYIFTFSSCAEFGLVSKTYIHNPQVSTGMMKKKMLSKSIRNFF